MTPRDGYQVLGVARDAAPADIRAAYARLVRRHHPDIAGELPGRLRDLQEAYRCLSDPVRRAEHDQALLEAERSHADRQRRVQRRLRGYDSRHSRPRRRSHRRWRLLVVLAAAGAVAAGMLARLPV